MYHRMLTQDLAGFENVAGLIADCLARVLLTPLQLCAFARDSRVFSPFLVLLYERCHHAGVWMRETRLNMEFYHSIEGQTVQTAQRYWQKTIVHSTNSAIIELCGSESQNAHEMSLRFWHVMCRAWQLCTICSKNDSVMRIASLTFPFITMAEVKKSKN